MSNDDPVLLAAITRLVESSAGLRSDLLDELNHVARDIVQLQHVIQALQSQVRTMRNQLYLVFAPVALLVGLILLSVLIKAFQ